MPEPKVRFKRDDGSSYPAWKDYSISDLFTKIGNKNKDGQNTNVITNSAEFGLIPQRDYFDKDIAVEGNTGNYTIIQTGDFVYNPRKSSYAPMGPFNCYRLEEDGIVSPLYSCLRPKGVLNPEYLLWYFQTDKWYGYVNDHGAQNGARHDRVGMTDKILMGIPVTAPCEEEQRKIADFLSSVDEVITASEGEVANLETQKKAVMKKIFSQEVRFKRADGSDFPEWEAKKLGDVGTVLMCKRVFKEQTDDEGDIPFFKIGTFGGTPDAFISRELFEDLKSKYSYPKKGNILLSAAGTIGRAVVYNGEDAYYQDSNIVWLDHDDTITDDYLLQFYDMTTWDNLEGGTVKRLYNGILLDKDIGIPCLEEQQLIADFLSNFDEAIAAAKKELELWKELKKGLLQQMFV